MGKGFEKWERCGVKEREKEEKRCSQDSTSSLILETSSTVISETSKLSDDQTSIPESSPTKVRKLDQDSNCLNFERDPELRKPIWDYPIDERDKIRRVYLKADPYQGIPKYSLQYVDRHGRRSYLLGTRDFLTG
ncbi:hypothetical protein BUALT_Bualt08G0121900 [Buddleja alternifolia]|uniref:Uncharacterized protein n=1 Tax=Buddleja alternifolia TaxID=168488 RepID=A0AAV6X6Y5_9LAMI|nr:hypothetical protein BUALT_Bualt08G0121900 [Buddleja alternifolia]